MSKSGSYEAEAHTAQMRVLRTLLIERSASFAQLSRAMELSSDHANFHIKKLVAAEMVQRVPRAYGQYELTRKGKEYANRMDTDELVIEKQPKLVVDIGIEHDGKFIFQERKKQPYYGYWGFPTGKIRWGETILEAAARELLEETGLTAELRIVGTYHKLDRDETGALLEDKYLILVHGTNPRGELMKDTETHTNQWMTPAEYQAIDKRFGDIEQTIGHFRADSPFIEETVYEYKGEAY